MFRIAMCIIGGLALSLSAYAGLPAATFTDRSAGMITEVWEYNYESYLEEVDAYSRPSPEASYVWARYLDHAFEKSGFSLEETLWTYVRDAHPGSLQMHLFAKGTGLADILALMSLSDEYVQAFAKAGVVSQRIVDRLDSENPKTPIREASYIFEGAPNNFPISSETSFWEYIGVGWIVVGEDDWEGWIVFRNSPFSNSGPEVGIAEIAELSPSERQLFEVMLDENGSANVKIQGTALQNPGADRFFDRREDLLIKSL